MEGQSSKITTTESDRGYSRSLGYYAWKRLRKDWLAMIGLGIIGLAAVIAILGANIRFDQSPKCDGQILEVSRKQPGFSVLMLQKRRNIDIQTQGFLSKLFLGGQPPLYELQPIEAYKIDGPDITIVKYTGFEGAEFRQEVTMPVADVLFPLKLNKPYTNHRAKQKVSFTTEDGSFMELSYSELRNKLLAENLFIKSYALGTDGLGRDMASRLMAGTFISLAVGLISVLISLFIGVTLGAVGGYFRGWVDDAIMWLINVVWSIPTLLLVIAITFALGKGFSQIFVAVGLTMWVEVARVVRGQIISLREQEFVEAGRALGFRSGRIIARHILPNVMGPVIVISAANFAAAILIESGLSYLGVGLQAPMASWGRMINENHGYIMTEGGGAYLAVLPGLCIMITVLAFMLVGNGLRDAFDTKSIGQAN